MDGGAAAGDGCLEGEADLLAEVMGLDEAEFRPLPSVRDSFTDDGEDVFLIKLNYWMGL